MSDSKQKRIFRAVALERLSSPEELDQLMQVNTPQGWLALVGIGVLAAAAIVWSFLGHIPIKIEGQGVLLRTQEIQQIPAPAAGQVRDILVKVGDTLIEEQPVVTLARTENGSVLSNEVTSAYEGRVLEIRTTEGATVNIGTPLLNVETFDQAQGRRPLEAIVYVPAAEGERVRPGMPVEVSPLTVNQAEFGFIRGRVESVGTFPVSQQGIQRSLRSDVLAEQFLSRDPVIEIRVSLDEDPNSISGYVWSSADPNVTIENGTLCTVHIIIARRQPISLVFPVLN